MGTGDMGRFWDERAREDAFYFVDNTGTYRDADVERFWMEGRRNLETVLAAVGAEVQPGDVVLDIGCGLGRLTRVLAETASHVVAERPAGSEFDTSLSGLIGTLITDIGSFAREMPKPAARHHRVC